MEADQALGRGTLRVVNKLPVLQEEKSSEHVGVADSANFYWTPEVSNG
ncbi:hypothetical protein [Thiohalophilus sp.]|nr:hypothetical protein [Thiohalophilus sp.]MDZ7804702.1 hypothetical protein [Thiohalophilus sp.]